MREEEKKAIEEVKEVIKIDKERRIVTIYDKKPLFRDQLQIIIDLINKQQKEIEDLKEQNTQLANYLYDSYYVSVDKIREKIEQYNNELEHIRNGEEFENEKPMYYWGKVALEELLKEEDGDHIPRID